MKNAINNLIIRSAVIALVISAGVLTTANAEVTRLSGSDRYLTADAIVKAGWSTGADTAILASGSDANEVDALTVAPLAKKLNAPIVLVNKINPVAKIVAKFTALNTKTVYLSNGTGVISKEIGAGLKIVGIDVIRLGGVNRYETAVNIAKKLDASTSIVIASGDNAHLADSLSIASIAGAKGMPILLAGNSLDKVTTEYIKGLGVKTTYVVGGTDTVADSVVNGLQGVIRLEGANRYDTNAKVIDYFKADASINLDNIFVASGENKNLIDSLAVSSLASSKGSPIVFAHDTINPNVNILLKSIASKATNTIVLGGIDCVTPLISYKIDEIVTGVDNNTAVTFADIKLEEAIRDALKKPTGDILKSDVENITSVECILGGIGNLAGIENLTNLNTLALHDSQITNIDLLKGLTKLTVLDLRWNQITNVEALSGLTKLTGLHLTGNQITNIEPLQGLTGLTFLRLEDNQISDLTPLKGLTNLGWLHLEGNQISDLTPVKGLNNLGELHIERNQITNVEALSGLTKLIWLTLDDDKIIDLKPIQFYYDNPNRYIYIS